MKAVKKKKLFIILMDFIILPLKIYKNYSRIDTKLFHFVENPSSGMILSYVISVFSASLSEIL